MGGGVQEVRDLAEELARDDDEEAHARAPDDAAQDRDELRAEQRGEGQDEE